MSLVMLWVGVETAILLLRVFVEKFL